MTELARVHDQLRATLAKAAIAPPSKKKETKPKTFKEWNTTENAREEEKERLVTEMESNGVMSLFDPETRAELERAMLQP
jgi:hypothetical protein